MSDIHSCTEQVSVNPVTIQC